MKHPSTSAFVCFGLSTFACAVDATCIATPAPNAAVYNCDVAGVVSNPKPLTSPHKSSSGDYTACRDACMHNAACLTFSYNSATGNCRQYAASLPTMDFVASTNSPHTFWSRHCFKVPAKCINTTPTTTTTSSSSLSSTTTSTPASNVVTSVPSIMTSTPPSSTPVIGTDFTATYTYIQGTLPTFTPGPSFSDNPTVTQDLGLAPSPSPACFIDPTDSNDQFNVVNGAYLPLLPNGGQIVVLNDSDFTLGQDNSAWTPPTYFFQAPSDTADDPGFYDLVVSGLYVGLDTVTGSVVTSSTSSDGSSPIEINGDTVVTTIFTIACDGTLSIQYNGQDYTWETAADGWSTIMTQGTPTQADQVFVNPTRSLPSASTRRKRQDPSTEGECPRCAYNPPNLQAIVAPGARPAEYNGCGSGATAQYIPQFGFSNCCDNHDLCYDDCTGGVFEQCNSNFLDCMLNNVCTQYSWLWHPVDRASCESEARLYGWVVTTGLGENAFYEANYFDPSQPPEDTGRCECTCPGGEYICGSSCTNVFSSDNNNCGGCGRTCSTGYQCMGGTCYCGANTQTDDDNCGGCGNVCPSDTRCSAGKCVCDTDTCGSLCVDFQTHPLNCGSCGNVCTSGYCLQGSCFTPPTPTAGAAPTCYPTNVVVNSGFDIDDGGANGYQDPWMIEAAYSGSGVGYDGGANSYPNSCAIDVREADTVELAQNITMCPNTQYQFSFVGRQVSYIGSNLCFWYAYTAGQELGNGVFNNPTGTTWSEMGPFYISIGPPSGAQAGWTDDADYTDLLYDSTGTFAYSQLAIFTSCANSDPTIIRYDDISLFPS